MTDRQVRFEFDSTTDALLFVYELTRTVRDVAMFRVGTVVHLVDGNDEPRREDILRIARSRKALQAVIDP